MRREVEMSKYRKRSLLRGAMAGIGGGLIASWIMNEFMTGPGKKLQESVEKETTGETQKKSEDESATMKAADAIVEITTGGRHLSREEKEKTGPIVHYSYGALMGGLYGGLAEYWSAPKAGFGTAFGTALFGAGDMVAVPALNLSPSSDGQPASAYVNPFLSHIVYGFTTELFRRALRPIL